MFVDDLIAKAGKNISDLKIMMVMWGGCTFRIFDKQIFIDEKDHIQLSDLQRDLHGQGVIKEWHLLLLSAGRAKDDRCRQTAVRVHRHRINMVSTLLFPNLRYIMFFLFIYFTIIFLSCQSNVCARYPFQTFPLKRSPSNMFYFDFVYAIITMS